MDRKSRKRITIAVVAVAIALVVLVAAFVLFKNERVPIPVARGEPIIIGSNADFTAANGVVSGKGSSDDPYIIEGWVIDGTNSSLSIRIFGTTAHFTIRHVHVENGLTGISLIGVFNGRVEHSYVANVTTGINVIECDSVAVVGNTVKGCSIGINIVTSVNIRLDNNHFSNNVQNVRQPSIPWEETWLGDLVCVAVLIPLIFIIGLAVYFRISKRPGKPQGLQMPIEGEDSGLEPPPTGPSK